MPNKVCEFMDSWIGKHIRHEAQGAGVFYTAETAVGMVAVRSAAKRVWKSRTIWINGLAVLFSSLFMLSPEIREAFGDVNGTQIVLVLGMINALLRVFTVSPVTFSREGDDNYDANTRYGPDGSDSGGFEPAIGPIHRQRIDRKELFEEGSSEPDSSGSSGSGSSSDKNPAGF
jgi:hypothetical protein